LPNDSIYYMYKNLKEEINIKYFLCTVLYIRIVRQFYIHFKATGIIGDIHRTEMSFMRTENKISISLFIELDVRDTGPYLIYRYRTS
jgi:hypothetical protein